MANRALHVLHVEDDFADAMLVQHAVCEAGDFDISFEVVRTFSASDRDRRIKHALHLTILP